MNLDIVYVMEAAELRLGRRYLNFLYGSGVPPSNSEQTGYNNVTEVVDVRFEDVALFYIRDHACMVYICEDILYKSEMFLKDIRVDYDFFNFDQARGPLQSGEEHV